MGFVIVQRISFMNEHLSNKILVDTFFAAIFNSLLRSACFVVNASLKHRMFREMYLYKAFLLNLAELLDKVCSFTPVLYL